MNTVSEVDCRKLRELILEQSRRANVGHIGCALSIVELLAVLYDGVLNLPGPRDADRDRFILSKGHAALALYAVLYRKGWLSRDTLDSYHGDASLLGVHPSHHLPGVDFSTGSLGHGLSYAAGAALAARIQGSQRRAFALLSDAECNEGSVWEAVMFAAHQRLANLTAVVDVNGQQALGNTSDVLDLSPLAERWRAFGWLVHEVDGHDLAALRRAFELCRKGAGRPQVILAQTIFGKGVSFMERQLRWHYQPMSALEYEQALREVRGAA